MVIKLTHHFLQRDLPTEVDVSHLKGVPSCVGKSGLNLWCKTSGFLFQSRMRNTHFFSKLTVSETTEGFLAAKTTVKIVVFVGHGM